MTKSLRIRSCSAPSSSGSGLGPEVIFQVFIVFRHFCRREGPWHEQACGAARRIGSMAQWLRFARSARSTEPAGHRVGQGPRKRDLRGRHARCANAGPPGDPDRTRNVEEFVAANPIAAIEVISHVALLCRQDGCLVRPSVRLAPNCRPPFPATGIPGWNPQFRMHKSGRAVTTVR